MTDLVLSAIPSMLRPTLATRHGLLAALVALCVVFGGRDLAAAAEPVDLSVVSFNVLVDFSRPRGFPAWKDRRDLCLRLLREAQADLIGLQEPSPAQQQFFASGLPEFQCVHYREGARQYTDALLFYRVDRFEELERGHWWLSPTPEKSSTGFGNALPRIVVWARLRERTSGRELAVFNTHFDNTMPSQVRMAELCEQKLAPFVAAGLPLIFMGDFNTHQARGDYPRLTSGGWRDAYLASPLASPDGRDDNVPTCGDRRIDHIFYHGAALRPVEWQRLESPAQNTPISDHWAIRARFKLTP